MLLLWMFGGQLYDFMGKSRFFILYFGSALVSSFAAMITMYYTGQNSSLSLCPIALLALATVWSMCTPQHNFFSLFFLPLPAKWFLAIGLIATIGSSIVQ